MNKMSSWRMPSRFHTLFSLVVLLSGIIFVTENAKAAEGGATEPGAENAEAGRPLLISSHSFSQSECEQGVAFTSDLVSHGVEANNNDTSSSPSSSLNSLASGSWEDVFGDFLFQRPRSSARWSCPKSIGVTLHSLSEDRETDAGAWLSSVLVSSRNCSNLIDRAQLFHGFSVELWVTFLEREKDDALGGAERLLFALDEREREGEGGDAQSRAAAELNGNGEQALCSANWPSFSFQLRQKGRRLVAEFRWSKTSSGVPICDIVQTGDVLYSGEPSNVTETEEGAEARVAEWALPKHLAITLEVGEGPASAFASPSPSPSKLVLYLDGAVSYETVLPETRAAVFRELWDRGHKLSFGTAYALRGSPSSGALVGSMKSEGGQDQLSPAADGQRAISWSGVIHQVKVYAGALSPGEVLRSVESGMPNSAPVASTKNAHVLEDAIDAIIELEAFDLDQSMQEIRAKHWQQPQQYQRMTIRFIITSLPAVGVLRDSKTGEDITMVSENGILEEDSSTPSSSNENTAARYPYTYGYKLKAGTHAVWFTPERDAFSFRATKGDQGIINDASNDASNDQERYSSSYPNPAYTSFEYVACDERSVCSSPATVFVHVLEVNDPPLALPSSTSTYVGLIRPVLFYARDVDDANLESGDPTAMGMAKKAHSVDILQAPRFGVLHPCSSGKDQQDESLASSNSLNSRASLAEASTFKSNRGNDEDGDEGSDQIERDEVKNNDLCYEFTNLGEARVRLERGEEMVATDSVVFRARDAENAKSGNNATVQIDVMNPLVSENQTVDCQEDSAALIHIRFGDLVAESEGRTTLSMMQQLKQQETWNRSAASLGVRITSIPKHGALFYQTTTRLNDGSLSDISANVKTGEVLLPDLEKEESSGISCNFGLEKSFKDKCITLKYVPDENFFNAPNLLEGSQAAKYRGMGLTTTVPNDTFTFEVTYRECCRSPTYHVNLRVSNTEDESNITLGKDPIVAHFMQPTHVEGLAIHDVDLYADLFLVDLHVTAGVLTIDSNLDALNYITFLIGDGHDDEKMVFRGLVHKVNEALSNLTYTPLKRNGEDLLTIKVTDMNSKALEFKDNLKYAQHTGSIDIIIQKSEEVRSESSSDNAKVCVKGTALCIPERILYAILLSILMLIFMAPPLYCMYKVMSCLLCRRKGRKPSQSTLSLPSHRNTVKKQSMTI